VVADEVGVDVDAGVGEDAEAPVLVAVEVEGVAVAAGEARVAARGAGEEVTHYIMYKTYTLLAGRRKRLLIVYTLFVIIHNPSVPQREFIFNFQILSHKKCSFSF